MASSHHTGPRNRRAPARVLSTPLRRLAAHLARALAAVLRETRIARGLSQEALAAMAGIDRSTVAVLEGGLRGTTLAMFVLLAQGLEVPPNELFDRVMARFAAEQKERGMP